VLDFYTPKYPISYASDLAELKLATGRSWFNKEWLYSDKKAAAPGGTALISGWSVLALAIAARLSRMGMHPKQACKAARVFVDLGEVDRRDPGELFSGPYTALVAYPDGDAEVLHANRSELLQKVFEPVQGRREEAYVLMLDFIVPRVVAGLQERG
jgi:hypothetical protein